MVDFPGKLCQHKQPSPHPCRKSPFRRGGGEGEEKKEEPLVLGSSDLPRSDPASSAHHRDHLCSLAFLTINQLLCGRETQRGCRLPFLSLKPAAHVNHQIDIHDRSRSADLGQISSHFDEMPVGRSLRGLCPPYRELVLVLVLVAHEIPLMQIHVR